MQTSLAELSSHAELIASRAQRLRTVMRERGVAALLTSQPINILYACGARNMTVFSMMGPFRMVLFFAEGPAILYEFAGSEHLAEGQPGVDEVRPAPGLTALSGPGYLDASRRFAQEVAELCRVHGDGQALAIEGFDLPVTDALRNERMHLMDATAVLSEARRIKTAAEIGTMREAVARVETAAAALETAIKPGASEVEVWAAFHQGLIASEGEYVSTRLFQSGSRTFPYFQEAGARRMQQGDLVCFDTDALGWQGYAVDFSRSFLCGDAAASPAQRALYKRAYEQLHTNAALLAPGKSYEEFARAAWPVPEENRNWGYYCLAHGLGLCGEFPYVPHAASGQSYDFPGGFEPGMVVCIESYIGTERAAQGVKLEDQFLITHTGVECMTTYPFDARLLA